MSIYQITKNDIEEILKREFLPLSLEVIDDSASHRGHAEALLQPKAGHFKVEMTSQAFDGLPQVKRHRLVYQALAELMDSRIHALSLNLRGSNE
jgi:BolA protein